MDRRFLRSLISRAKIESKTTNDFIASLDNIEDFLCMEDNVRKQANDRLATFFSISLEKFYQIKLEELGYGDSKNHSNSPNKNHWMIDMRNALISASKSNSGYKRGYVFGFDLLSNIFSLQKLDSLSEAMAHLDISDSEIENNKLDINHKNLLINLDGIYRYVDLVFPHEFKHEKKY